MDVFENWRDPLVSVIVPCYNHQQYIVNCIESIINQTYRNFELIVIDDGSSDQSPEILKELQKKYNFTLILQENIGLSASLNKAMQNFAQGTYISLCASDDYWCLNKLELQVRFMQEHPNIPMCYGKVHYINEDSVLLKNYDKNNNHLYGGNLFDDIFLFKLHPPVNYMYRASLFDEIGYFDKDIYAEDYYMNLKTAKKYEIGFIDEYLSYYRVDSSFSKIIRFDKVSDSHLQSIEEYKNHPLYDKAKTTVFLRKFMEFASYKVHKKLAAKSAIKAFSFFYKKNFIIASAKLILVWK